jgi:hypothetical protein
MQPAITMTDTPEPHVRKAIVGPLIDFNNGAFLQSSPQTRAHTCYTAPHEGRRTPGRA